MLPIMVRPNVLSSNPIAGRADKAALSKNKITEALNLSDI